jgi:ABC-type Na+ efflux pump permease subunit
VNWQQVRTVSRTDLLQLIQAKDFWIPMLLLGSFFFLFIPAILLLAITNIGEVESVKRVSDALEVLPESTQAAIPGASDDVKVSYTMAVFLFAPIAVVVPLTISTAVGASTIVGERERGTGEFLAHSPAGVHEIYLGKLLASFAPGYFTTLVGFGLYSILVNVLVGPDVGGWFFPTPEWWVLILWVIPPFLVLALSLVLRLSARVKSTAAAQQASGLVTLPLIVLAYGQSTGALFGRDRAAMVSFFIGCVAWILAATFLLTGMSSLKRARLLGVADEQ